MAPKTAIPAWQRSTSLPGSEEPSKPDESAKPEEKETSETTEQQPSDAPMNDEVVAAEPETLREQATRFLQDPSIRDANRERKVAFLESKGVNREDIESLLGKAPEQVVSETPYPALQQPAQPPREVPPVITYPEFLVHASKPPPLVTTNLLLNTAYVTAGLYATIYGLSKYIIAPLEASLSESRHDFLSHATSQLEDFNTRLSLLVSTTPPSRPTTSSGLQGKDGDHPDDISDLSDDSDPTELFHRDIGTQTSPPLSRQASSSDLSDLANAADALHGHENRLRIMSSHLKDLQTSNSSIVEKEDDVNKQLSTLTSYLNDLTYSSPYYRYGNSAYGGWSGSDTTGNKDDEIEKLKTEIRGVKGVLLSTRNFPRGSAGG